MSTVTLAALSLSLATVYLTLLSRRLCNVPRKSNVRTRPTPTAEELDAISYANIDMLDTIPREPTHSGYVVIGGSGFVGINIVRLLLLRGETSIRILDTKPPPAELLANPAIDFVQTDMTLLSSTHDALGRTFANTNRTADVVFHVAAAIRFWERASYLWPISKKINVDGTKNILASLPSTAKILIYTSTGDISIPRPKYLSLGLRMNHPEYQRVAHSDEDTPLKDDMFGLGCYVRSKRMAEAAVLQADTVNGLRTGALRPGSSIIGLNDRLISATLLMPRFPVFDSPWSTTPVDVLDVAAAHLQYEKALQERPDEVAAKAYLISAKDPAIKLGDMRLAIQHYSTRTPIFDNIPVTVIFLLAHAVEAFLWCRYHFLYPFYRLKGVTPSLLPRWIGDLAMVQPATLQYLNDLALDSTRAQKEIGYRPQWGTLQTIRHVVESFESGKSGSEFGLTMTGYA